MTVVTLINLFPLVLDFHSVTRISIGATAFEFLQGKTQLLLLIVRLYIRKCTLKRYSFTIQIFV
jgi:hypothetical protein